MHCRSFPLLRGMLRTEPVPSAPAPSNADVVSPLQSHSNLDNVSPVINLVDPEFLLALKTLSQLSVPLFTFSLVWSSTVFFALKVLTVGSTPSPRNLLQPSMLLIVLDSTKFDIPVLLRTAACIKASTPTLGESCLGAFLPVLDFFALGATLLAHGLV